MKKAKKLLVTLLVLTFVLSIMGTGFAQSTTTAASTESAEVTRAKALGILKGDEKGNLNLDKPITRAEALALIIRISGLEASADLMKGQTKFTDVNSDAGLQWATGYINLGVGQGIVNGYPDGTFKGRNTVTYAEMAKLLLYAMNYGVTVEGTVWPAGVMGKADDLGLFDNVNATPNVPALRGDVVKMIDNSLTVKHLKQTGYGDLKSYEEGTDTFLSKMKVDEIDGRVTAVDVKKDQVTVTPDEDETDITKATTYTLLDKTVDVEGLLGVAVTVWVNDDDEIFFIDPEMDDVKVDVVDANVAKDADTIDLRVADDTFDLASDVKVYINGTKSDLEDLKAGMYGSFVFDNDEIIYINVKNWNEVNAGVVKEVKDNIITYFDTDGNDNELDLEDPDDGYVITLDGKAINADDVEKNDVIYVADYDDMYHIVVVRNAVTGKVERINDDEVKIDGTTYDVDVDDDGNAILATYSLDKDDEIARYVADYATDLTGEEATAILDIAGYLRHITSAVDVTSDEIYGVVTRANDYNDNFKIFANGESTSYDLDGDVLVKDGDDWVDVTDTYDIQALTKAGDYPIVEFELTKDGEIDDLYVYGVWNGSNVVAPVVGGTTYDVVDTDYVTVTDFDEDHDSIKTNHGTFFVTSTTGIVDDIDDMDAVKWEDIEEKDVKGTVNAVVVSNSKDEANLVVFTGDTFSEISDDTEVGVVLDKFVEDGDWKATVRVHDGETTDYFLNDKNDVEIGQVIVFQVNSDNEIDLVGTGLGVKVDGTAAGDGYDKFGLVTKKDGNYLTVGGGVYKVDSATLIYDVTDGLDDINDARLTDVKSNKTTVGLVLDDNLIQVLYIISESDEDVDVGDSGLEANKTYTGTVKSKSNLDMTLTVTVDSHDYKLDVTDSTQFIDVDGDVLKGLAGLAKAVAADAVQFKINSSDELTIVQFASRDF